MRIGKQHWQKVVSLIKKFATPRSKELERELSSIRRDYRELGLRASTLASEGDTARKTLGKAKQQIERAHDELGAAYKARDQLTLALQEQLESLKTGIKELQTRHHELMKGFAERGRQFETLAVELAGIQHEFETSSNNSSTQLADLEMRLGDIESDRGSTRDQLQALEHSLTEAASRHSDTQQQVRALAAKLGEERQRRQVNLNKFEEKLARVQIEQEGLINIQSGLTDSLRKNRRWATVAVGLAFLTGVLAAVTQIGYVREDVPDQAGGRH